MTYIPTFAQAKPKTRKEVALAKNELGFCSEPGCTGSRHGLGKLCQQHYIKVKQYGHARGKPIGVASYKPYRALVIDVLQANGTHPGLIAALAFITQWLAASVTDPAASKSAPEMCRLANDGVNPLAILAEICAVWAWIQDNPRQLPSTQAENFAMARGLLALSPKARRYQAVITKGNRSGYTPKANVSALRAIGTTVRASLAYFLVNIHQAISTREEREKATLQALRTPLISPVSTQMLEKISNESTIQSI